MVWLWKYLFCYLRTTQLSKGVCILYCPKPHHSKGRWAASGSPKVWQRFRLRGLLSQKWHFNKSFIRTLRRLRSTGLGQVQLLLAVLVNKTLWGHSHICSSWLFSHHHRQSWAAASETTWPVKPKTFTRWPCSNLWTRRRQRFLALVKESVLPKANLSFLVPQQLLKNELRVYVQYTCSPESPA